MKSADKLCINFDPEEVILSISDTLIAIRALQTSPNPNLNLVGLKNYQKYYPKLGLHRDTGKIIIMIP